MKETTRNNRNREGKSTAGTAANRNKFIQLQGVFSQGVGEARLRNGFSENRASYRSHEIPVAKVRKREVGKILFLMLVSLIQVSKQNISSKLDQNYYVFVRVLVFNRL